MGAECVWPFPYQVGQTYPVLDEERIARKVIEILKQECPEIFKNKEPA